MGVHTSPPLHDELAAPFHTAALHAAAQSEAVRCAAWVVQGVPLARQLSDTSTALQVGAKSALPVK